MTSLAAADRAPASRFRLAGRLLALVEASHARAIAALVALSLLCFGPGFVSLQPMDRDEPRFAQASKQMLETGDLVDIRFQDEARNKKPVGIYWAQAAAVAAGRADAGLGILAAARAFGLGFVPVASEPYDLVVRDLADPRLAPLLALLADPGFRARVEALGGYSCAETGRRIR